MTKHATSVVHCWSFLCILYFISCESLNFFKGAVHSFSQYQHDGEKMKVLFQTFFLIQSLSIFFMDGEKKSNLFSNMRFKHFSKFRLSKKKICFPSVKAEKLVWTDGGEKDLFFLPFHVWNFFFYILKITCVERCSLSFTHEKVKNIFQDFFFLSVSDFFLNSDFQNCFPSVKTEKLVWNRWKNIFFLFHVWRFVLFCFFYKCLQTKKQNHNLHFKNNVCGKMFIQFHTWKGEKRFFRDIFFF